MKAWALYVTTNCCIIFVLGDLKHDIDLIPKTQTQPHEWCVSLYTPGYHQIVPHSALLLPSINLKLEILAISYIKADVDIQAASVVSIPSLKRDFYSSSQQV